MSATRRSILIADDDVDALRFMAFHLKSWNLDVHTACDKPELFEKIANHSFGLMVLDLEFGQWDGIEILAQLDQQQVSIPTVFLTCRGTIEKAVQAIKLGAIDFLTKPPDLYQFRRLVEQLLSERELPTSRPKRKASKLTSDPFEIVGQSRPIEEMRQLISDVARTNAKAMIIGETGTGKELIARQIHQLSPRSENAFVPINMAALPENLTESLLFGHKKGSFTGADDDSEGSCRAADKGTLFLDEIGEMPLGLQAKILRFLQAGTVHQVGSTEVTNVDVRVVAATNRTRAELLEGGRLREDLFYRLNVVPINVPPLRDRDGDVPVLAHHFLKSQQKLYPDRELSVSDGAMNALINYGWPGNVRELECIIERLCITARNGAIRTEDLPHEITSRLGVSRQRSASTSYRDESLNDEAAVLLRPMDQIQKNAILDALDNSGGNVVEAANRLGVGQATVYRKMKRFGIVLPSKQMKTSRQIG